jgi:hypothetical protein
MVPRDAGANNRTINPNSYMNRSTRTIIMAAAIAGLYAGSLAVKAYAEDAGKTAPAGEKSKDSCKGKDGCKGKDSCKGKNDCKGKGNCKTADNTCKGKNSCKGKGGCAAAPEVKKDEPKK